MRTALFHRRPTCQNIGMRIAVEIAVWYRFLIKFEPCQERVSGVFVKIRTWRGANPVNREFIGEGEYTAWKRCEPCQE